MTKNLKENNRLSFIKPKDLQEPATGPYPEHIHSPFCIKMYLEMVRKSLRWLVKLLKKGGCLGFQRVEC